MHPLQVKRLPGVDLENHTVGLIEPCLVVAHRGAWHQASILQNRRHFHHRDVELAEKAVLHQLGDVAEVNVQVLGFAGIDPLADVRVGLIGKTQAHAPGPGQRSIQFRTGGGPGKDADLELFSARVGFVHAAGQLRWNSLGVAGSGESTDPDLVSVLDQGRGFIGAHDLLRQIGIQDT